MSPRANRRVRKGRVLIHVCLLLGLGWFALLSYGLFRLESYAATPGDRSKGQVSKIASGDTHRLLLFLHPECSCSRATLAEVGTLLNRTGPGLSVTVYFALPPGAPDSWKSSPLVEQARSIPGVQVEMDPGGIQCLAFGAKTSGQALLYGPDGRIEFNGGLTVARGHEGDNAGCDAITEIVRHQRPETRETPVFGCTLQTPTS